MAEEEVQEYSGDIRKKALVRLGIAAVVTALALVALWWLDNSGVKTEKTIKKNPAPIVSAPVQSQPAEPQAIALPPPPPTPQFPAGQSEQSGQPAQTGQETTPTTPPPPPTVSALPPPRPHAHSKAPVPVTRKHGHPAARISVPPEKPAATAPYNVQVGVFADPAHAQELVDRLHKAGIPAYLETRVRVGPFTSRKQAEKAETELRKLGIHGLINRSAATK